MPLIIKKIVHISDNGTDYHRYVFNLEEPTQLNYAVGEFQGLIPENAMLQNDNKYLINYPLFNKARNAKIIEKVESQGLLYLSLKPKQVLNKIFVEPKFIDIDVYYGENNLIYSFYNGSDNNLLSLTLSVNDDNENVYSKIKANSTDIEWRQYFIKKATDFPNSITNPTKLQIREYRLLIK